MKSKQSKKKKKTYFM